MEIFAVLPLLGDKAGFILLCHVDAALLVDLQPLHHCQEVFQLIVEVCIDMTQEDKASFIPDQA